MPTRYPGQWPWRPLEALDADAADDHDAAHEESDDATAGAEGIAREKLVDKPATPSTDEGPTIDEAA